MFDNLRADLDHYRRLVCRGTPLWRAWVRIILAHPAAAAVIWYRFGSWASRWRVPVAGHLVRAVYLLLMPLVRLYSGVQILPETEIGPGLAIMHFGGVVITRQCRIGCNCLLYHNVSIVTMRNRQGPDIGDNFYAGTGATLIGAIVIEDDVSVGAGSVVTRSVPRDCVVAGVPARFVRYREPDEHPADNRTLPPRPASWVTAPARSADQDMRPDGSQDHEARPARAGAATVAAG